MRTVSPTPASEFKLRYFNEFMKSSTSMRPKKHSIQAFIKIIEDIYTAKYRQDMSAMEAEIIRKVNNKNNGE